MWLNEDSLESGFEGVKPTYSGMVFKLDAYFQVKGCYEIEQFLHNYFREKGNSLWAELFDVTFDDIKKAILECYKQDNRFQLLMAELCAPPLLDEYVQCTATTINGTRCTHRTKHSSLKCTQHNRME